MPGHSACKKFWITDFYGLLSLHKEEVFWFSQFTIFGHPVHTDAQCCEFGFILVKHNSVSGIFDIMITQDLKTFWNFFMWKGCKWLKWKPWCGSGKVPTFCDVQKTLFEVALFSQSKFEKKREGAKATASGWSWAGGAGENNWWYAALLKCTLGRDLQDKSSLAKLLVHMTSWSALFWTLSSLFDSQLQSE